METSVNVGTGNPFDEEDEPVPSDGKSKEETNEISYHEIATKLLNDNLLLTALELHTELVEAGKEIPKLRVFFSNPGNFEYQASIKPEVLSPTSIPRSLSQATLDSLDLTRYSEDGERGVDERVAVLEFELRKARETISALRANLTVATESETPTPDGGTGKLFGSDSAKPHEQRALNFLVNEYLLLHGYKLTSITFSDENENQDFEDWDDVGLNIPKPPELLQLYRDYMRQVGHTRPPGHDAACQTDDRVVDHIDQGVCTDIDPTVMLDDELLTELRGEVKRMKERINEVEREKGDLQERLWAYERLPGDGEMTEMSPRKSSRQREVDRFERDDEDGDGDGWTPVTRLDIGDMVQQRVGTDDDQISADIDWASVTMSTPDPLKVPGSESQSGSGSASGSGVADARGQATEDDDHNSADTEWTPITVTPTQRSNEGRKSSAVNTNHNLGDVFNRPVSAAFQQEVFAKCMVDTARLPEGQQHVLEALHSVSDLFSVEADTLACKLINILAHALVRVIPNVILNKREEVIPLLVAAIRLHPEGKERDMLLHQLFNLKKRPEEEERRLILTGLTFVAQGMDVSSVENEVLPQCWEQINHRHCERRLLVAEACGVLTPYISVAIRNSLVLSMLQQMLSEDREEVVRVAVVRSAALIAALSPDCDKYAQCEDLVISCIGDTSVSVVRAVISTLLPVVAQWALSTDRLQLQLFARLVAQLKIQLKSKVVESPRSPSTVSPSTSSKNQRALNFLTAITSILPHVVLSVADVDAVHARITPDLPAPQPRAGFSELCRGFSSPAVFHIGKASIGQVIAAFDALMEKEGDSLLSWPHLCWVSENMVPELLEAVSQVEICQDDLLTAFVTLFRFLCAGFGPVVVLKQVKPVFAARLQEVEKALVEATGSQQRSSWPSLSVVTVYLAGVLATGQSEEEMEELRSTLRRFLLALPLCGAAGLGWSPLDGLQAAVSALCAVNKEAVHESVLATLWEGVVSQRAPVRCATAMLFTTIIGSVPESHVSTRVAPALVTLASDPDTSVRTATVPAFGKLISSTTTKEVKEKVCLQLQNVLSDPATRDSHPLLLQLISTLGQVATACDATFREDVVLPQLAALAAYASQLQNLTRRLDLAVALTEAFSAVVYCPLPSSVLTSAVLPGLRYLEQISQQLQPVHRETIIAMIREVESRSDMQPTRREERSGSRSLAVANMNQGVEDMRQRMSKMFQPKSIGTQPGLPSGLPNLFRKK